MEQIVFIQLTEEKTVILDLMDEDLLKLKWYFSQQRGSGYVARKPVGGIIYLHRVIMSRMIGRELKRGEFVDHINRNTLDNRRSNLRLATNSQNHANREKDKSNTSGYKGVYKKGNKWQAAIWCNNKRFLLGVYSNIYDAANAYNKKAQELFGEFARLNKIHG